MKDYKDKPRTSNTRILGSNGNSNAKCVGTVKWRIEDHDGRQHNIIIPDTYYSKDVPYKLLSSQNWAQTVNDHTIQQGMECGVPPSMTPLKYRRHQIQKKAMNLRPNA